MASKKTTMKLEVEKFDEKNNFLLWKMRVTLLGIKKSSKMEDDEWMDLDVEPMPLLYYAYRMKFFTI